VATFTDDTAPAFGRGTPAALETGAQAVLSGRRVAAGWERLLDALSDSIALFAPPRSRRGVPLSAAPVLESDNRGLCSFQHALWKLKSNLPERGPTSPDVFFFVKTGALFLMRIQSALLFDLGRIRREAREPRCFTEVLRVQETSPGQRDPRGITRPCVVTVWHAAGRAKQPVHCAEVFTNGKLLRPQEANSLHSSFNTTKAGAATLACAPSVTSICSRDPAAPRLAWYGMPELP